MTHKDVSTYSIGMFDSGIGGLTVLQKLFQVLPAENFVYFGDTARLPYGEKSQETIIRYSIENTIFLLDKNIKLLVVPCNTASAYALDKLQQLFNIPVIGVIEPGADTAIELTTHGRIAVLGTKGTVNSGAYQKAILKRNPKIVVTSLACPLFVPLVEENYLDHPATKLIVHEYLKPLKEHKIDTLLLGCTHYPLLKELIQKEMGDDIAIVDSATACANKVVEVLIQRGLKVSRKADHEHQYFVSDDPHKFQILGEAFLGMPIRHVELVNKNSF